MKIRNVIVLLCAGVMLTACSEENSNANVQEGDSSAAERKSVSELYLGYEELQGKDLGMFTMPESIAPQEIGGLCTFTINKRFTVENEQNGKRVFKAFWGDDFNESKCGFSKAEGDPSYQYGEGGEDQGYFYNGTISLQRAGAGMLLGDSKQTLYSAADRETTVQLAGGTASIGELTDSVKEFIKSSGADILYGDFSIEPAEVFVCDTDKGAYANVVCSAVLNGVPVETYPSHYFKEGYENGEKTITFYLFKYLSFYFSGKDRLETVTVPPSYHIFEKKELTSAITLEGAVELLKTELAEHSDYKFSDVKLMYCCRSTKPSDEDTDDDPEMLKQIEERILDMHEEFVPTWCFTYDISGGEGRNMIKVNAVNGEITIDKE